MSRYIDADALKQKYTMATTRYSGGIMERPVVVLEAIDDAPSIDIVRCKECRHNYNKTLNHGKMQPRCDFADWKLTENDFCSRGEREGK